MSERTEAEFSTLREANVHRQSLWDSGNQITLAYRGNEMAGEVGEACNVIKKIERERLGIRGSRATLEQLAEELADVVICADLIAMGEGIDLLGKAVPDKFNATSEKVGLPTRLWSYREEQTVDGRPSFGTYKPDGGIGPSFADEFAAQAEVNSRNREVLSRHPEPPTGGDVEEVDETGLLVALEQIGALFDDGTDSPLNACIRKARAARAAWQPTAETIARLRERVAELEGEDFGKYVKQVEAELSSLKAAGTRADGIEAAAKVHEPSCSCPHPCDDYFIWPSPCHKKAAAVIRALAPAPEAKPLVGDWPARAVIDGDCISIRVPISALSIAFDCLPPGYGMRDGEGNPLFEVSNAAEFAKSVTRRLNDEEEDGTTLIHTMLDKAMAEAVEQGDDGIDEIASRFGKEGR